MTKNRNNSGWSWAAVVAPWLLTSCGRAPAIDILGSFFPAWLVCVVAAILLTVIGRLVLVRFHMNFDLPILAYPSLVALLTFALWLIFFH